MRTPSVTYVRHAMPQTDDGADPSTWHLGEEGTRLAGRLAGRLEVASSTPRIGALVSSTEPKAIETATAIAAHWKAEVVTDDRLREVTRPWVGDGYRSVAHRYLRGEVPAGWETHEDVAARTGAAVHAARASAGEGPVVIVSHGLALSVHLGALLGGDFDRDAFWRSLAFPDAWTLDEAGTLHRPLVGIGPPSP